MKNINPHNNKPLAPIVVKFNKLLFIKLTGIFLLLLFLWVVLLTSASSILVYYIFLIMTHGLLHPETVKWAIFIVAGMYVILILDKEKIYDLLGIKNVSIIPIEQTNLKD